MSAAWLNPARWLLITGLVAALIVGYGVWAKHQQAIGYERARTKFQEQAGSANAQRAKVAAPLAKAQQAAQVQIRTVTKTIIQEVPVYVPMDSCALPGGYRLLHDAAANGVLPDPARRADAAPVPAQDAAATTADNYGTCHETAARLRGLQAWVSAQQALN